jgi:hypothetical protein
MSGLMSTVGVDRHRIHARRGSVGPAAVVGALLACVLVFAAAFAAGRALSPTSVPHEVEPSSLTRASSGAAIPATLGDAPAIELRVPVRHFVSHHVTETPAEIPVLSSAQSPVEVAPTIAVATAPAVSSTPSSSESSAPSTHHESSGQSFDSSG